MYCKWNKRCRFNFPHPPSAQTVIANEDNDIKSTLAKVRKLLIDGNNDITLDSLLQMADIRSSDYESAMCHSYSV